MATSDLLVVDNVEIGPGDFLGFPATVARRIPDRGSLYEKLGIVCAGHAIVPMSGVPVWFLVRPLG